MTNGEKIQTILNVDRDCTEVHGENGTMTFTVTQEFWNAEYKEPTIKKDCNTCTHGDETDGSNCYECVKDICNNYEPNTKNDLGVDLISREQAIEWVDNLRKMDECFGNHKGDYYPLSEVIDRLQNVPSVTPQYSSELEKNSKKLEKDFGELDCISRADAIKAMQEKSKRLKNLDTINGLCGAVAILYDMPSVTPQEPRWIPVSERLPKAEYGESDSVLVCFENGTQDVLYFDGSNWRYPTGESYISVNHKNGWHNKVIAWMPLPKPYKADRSK